MKEPWYKSPLVFTLGAITTIGLGVSAFNDGASQTPTPELVPVVSSVRDVLPSPTGENTSPAPEANTVVVPAYSEASYYSQATYYAEASYYAQSSYQATETSCNKNYSGCLKSNAGDYDCAGGTGNGPNYTGPVQVLGYDEYGLDRDNDGWACE